MGYFFFFLADLDSKNKKGLDLREVDSDRGGGHTSCGALLFRCSLASQFGTRITELVSTKEEMRSVVGRTHIWIASSRSSSYSFHVSKSKGR